MLKEDLKKAYVLFNMRQGRGAGYIDRFRDLFILGGAAKLYFPDLPIIALIPLGLGWLSITYLIGYFDEKKLKIWQLELDMNAKWVNPYNQRIEDKMDKVVSKVGKD